MTNQDANQALLHAASHGDRGGILKAMDMGADINARHPESDATPLMLAAGQGYPECVQTLLNFKPDIEATNCNDFTALMAAVERGWPDCVRLLLAADADWEFASRVIIQYGSAEMRSEIERMLMARIESEEIKKASAGRRQD